MIKKTLKKSIPAFASKLLGSTTSQKKTIPRLGSLSLGDLNSVTPVSTEFGYDRGGPVDRYYIENFLNNEAKSIHGRVLEIGDNEYTLKFGKENVIKSDILHVNDKNPNATIIGDISYAPQINDNSFDCIVLTQTLHLIYDFKQALATCYRILKPGGALLLTVPGITPIDHGEWKETWYWSFTDKALKKLFEEIFITGKAEINSFGNVYAATTFLHGLGLPEVSTEKLDHRDPHFPVINTVKAIKG